MSEDIKLTAIVNTIMAIILYFVPETLLNLSIKIIIFLSVLIISSLYKLYDKNKKYKLLEKQFNDVKKKHAELSKLFDERIHTIDELKLSIHNYNHLISILEQSLSTAMLYREDNKEIIDSLLKLILHYKEFMEDDKYE